LDGFNRGAQWAKINPALVDKAIEHHISIGRGASTDSISNVICWSGVGVIVISYIAPSVPDADEVFDAMVILVNSRQEGNFLFSMSA
jgi:hypothetical protein